MEAQMNRNTFALFLTLVFIGVTNANAEPVYRDEEKVLEPPKVVVPPDQIRPAIADFSKLYKKAHSPKIALFWNMALSDSVKDNQVKTVKITGSSKDSINTSEQNTSGLKGAMKLTDGDEISKFNITKTESNEKVSENNQRSTTLTERDMLKTQTSFMNTMRRAGVRFIDRNSILRVSAISEKAESTPELETKALLHKADLLMEVIMVKDDDAPLGWGFKMSLKNLKTGEEKSALYTLARPLASSSVHSEYRATDTGFEKITYQPKSTIEDVGASLAVDVMSEIGSKL